ncbi:MAG: LTA synthase family protein [Succinivibrio sp.]
MSTILNRNKENLINAFSVIASGVIFCFALTFICRLAILFSFCSEAFSDISLGEQLNFFVLSARYDIKVILIAYALPLLCSICLFSLSFFDRLTKAIRLYSHIVVLIFFIFSVINFFYFKTYDSSINTFIFAISKEDPLAVVKTIVNDYPVISGSVAILIACYIYSFISPRLIQAVRRYIRIPADRKYLTALFLFIVAACFVLIRGSFGTFPLRQLNAQVCDKPSINSNLPSGVLAFYWAYQWEKNSLNIPLVDTQEIADTYRELGIKINKDDFSSLFSPLKNRSSKNQFLKDNPPDIVFNVMESMSYHLLTYDNGKDIDLLGALREHIDKDMFFTNFISEGDGTSDSLTRLMLSVPDLNLSTSAHANKKYICNIVDDFKNAGYETIFITASSSSWRNYDNFLRIIGFDRVIERSNVIRDFPDATSGAWGIDDEYLFKETFKVLKEKHDKPRFIMTLSITNHPPYRLPKHVDVQEVNIDDKSLERFSYSNTKTIFATFRYANDELGKFISAVKTDPELSSKTYIAATGDHNLRGIGYSDHPDELVFGHAVPFYLYMPDQYIKETKVKYNRNRAGSHKDIISTILHHATSEHTFYSFGCDMLSDRKCNFPYSYNGSVVVKHGQKYACSLYSPYEGIAYRFSREGNMKVFSKKIDASCSQEAAMRRISEQLYYFQAKLNAFPDIE